jgi:hypothetical protein
MDNEWHCPKAWCWSRVPHAHEAPQEQGRKDDAEKPQWALLPWGPLEVVVQLLTLGARKYAPDNWKRVPDAERRYLDAATRHLAEVHKGNLIDPETNLPHMAAVVCNGLFYLWFQLRGQE